MKTSKSNSPKKPEGILKIVGTFLSAAFLLVLIMSGCKKDNLDPVTTQKIKNEARIAQHTTSTFDMIKINHDANLTSAPDYSVTIRSDGLVTYEGRSHVLVKRKIEFSISPEMVRKLDAIFAPPSFTEVQANDETRMGLPEIPEHVLVTTTYFNGHQPPKIWVGSDNGYPVDVVYRRKKVEQLL
jgi:hypothetical protein